MENPFEIIIERLDRNEKMLLELKVHSVQNIPKDDKEKRAQIILDNSIDTVDIHVAALILCRSESTIRSKVSKGELPSITRGKPLLFSKEQLMKYLKSRYRKTIAEIDAEAVNGLQYYRKKKN